VTLAGKLLLPLVWLFAGPSARKALRDDLEEIKAGVERCAGGPHHRGAEITED
jgi:hypothetical protein